MDHYIFEGGSWAIFFSQEFFTWLKALYEIACNISLCFVLLCTIFISSAKAVQEFFSY